MLRTPRQDLEQELKDVEFAKLYGTAQAKDEFAVALTRARRMSEITQKELAQRLELSQPYIAKLEGGEANCTISTIGSLLAVLGCRLVVRTEPLSSLPVTAPCGSTENVGVKGNVVSLEDNATFSSIPISGGTETKKPQILVASSVA